MESKKTMVDATKYVDDRIPFLRVEDVKNIKGDLRERSGLVVGEGYFKDFKDREDPTKSKSKLVIPVELKEKMFLLVLNLKSNQRMVEVLGGDTLGWVGSRISFSIAGTTFPSIMVDVLEKPRS
jgi:hypothetical protein